MGSTNIGNQILTYDYRQEVIAEGFNRLNYKLLPRGIYEGGGLLKINDTTVNILPFVCLYNYASGDTGVAVRIETKDSATVYSVSPATPYIIGKFIWINTEENYMDFQAVNENDIVNDYIVFGRAIFNGSVMTTSFDYSKSTYPILKTLNLLNNSVPPFYVVPNTTSGGYTNQVKVFPGGPLFFNGNLLIINSETTLTINPAPSTGRTDIIYISSVNNSLYVKEGVTTAGAPLPTLSIDSLPIAIISMPGNTSIVQGNYITYIHPYNFLSNKFLLTVPNTEVGAIWVE
jgi:hypothetical protein